MNICHKPWKPWSIGTKVFSLDILGKLGHLHRHPRKAWTFPWKSNVIFLGIVQGSSSEKNLGKPGKILGHLHDLAKP